MTSCIAAIYDPLGLIAPFILPAKLLLQSSCKTKAGWDEELLGSTSDQLSAWLAEMPEIENFRLRRWFGCTRESTQYIHMFSDACERSYGAAAYLAVKRGRENVSTLVTAKSKVAPPRKLTIPKMEMAGAVLAVKMIQLIKKMFGVFVSAFYFWIDSTIVLILIRKDPDVLKTFMANRVSYIQSLTETEHWGHVAGVLNPADIASRGVSMKVLNESMLWKHGPEFLKADPDTWNKLRLEVLETPDITSEEKRPKPVFCGMVTTGAEEGTLIAGPADCLVIKHEMLPENLFRMPDSIERATLNTIVQRYSSWDGAVRLAVILAKFVAWLKRGSSSRQKMVVDREITVSEIKREELNLLSWEQSISLGEATVKEQTWKQLLPFWEGVWRVGGRCQLAELDDDTKHPIILPRHSVITELIIREAHRSGGHGGTVRTMKELRGHYWVLGGKPTVKRIIDPCVTCKRLRGKPIVQQMAPLPSERVAPRKPPFTHAGVDLFGPLPVIVKRSQVKRYGAIFTCFNTRAVHLEPVEDLSASAFLDTVERFTMRRTKPETLKSDNGTNFVRSEKEMVRAADLLASGELRRSLTSRRIEWSFNTPAASHQGGVWERLIHSARQIIVTLLSEQVVTDARLHTVLCITEGILNSRPLTRLTDDVRDLNPLTPRHFTGGGRITSAIGLAMDGGRLRQDWKLSQDLAERYWDQWISSYLPILQRRTKWQDVKQNLRVGELVLVINDKCSRFEWPMARVLEVHAGRDGLVRNATVRMSEGILKRPVQKLVRLELDAPEG